MRHHDVKVVAKFGESASKYEFIFVVYANSNFHMNIGLVVVRGTWDLRKGMRLCLKKSPNLCSSKHNENRK